MDVYVEFIEESRRRKKLVRTCHVWFLFYGLIFLFKEFERVKTELESVEEELKGIKSSQRTSSDLSESGTVRASRKKKHKIMGKMFLIDIYLKRFFSLLIFASFGLILFTD